MSTTTCPVFYPTEEQFSNFKLYIHQIKDECKNIGICKIVPPTGWFKRSYDLKDLDEQIKVIETPIKQILSGRAGIYEADLLEMKPMSVSEISAYAASNCCPKEGDDENDFTNRERKFWKSIGNTSDWDYPIYGADVPGTLFDSESLLDNELAESWNVNNLDDGVLSLLEQRIPGVNTSYLYVGTWRAMFAFHTEDYDLYSINYVHTGDCKSWYAVQLNDRARFESMAQAYFPEDSQHCKEFLRHKTKLFSPYQLKQHGISYSTVLQRAGEFVVTFPGSYHAGFNHGFNVAESTNFSTPDWFDAGRQAHCCVCRPGSVRIDVLFLETLFLRHKQNQKQLNISKNNNSNNSNSNNNYKTSSSSSSSSSSFWLDQIECNNNNRLRCKCGKDKSVLSVDPATVYECCRCGLFNHYTCNKKTIQFNSKQSNQHQHQHQKEEELLCYICSDIEGLDDDNDDEDMRTRLLVNLPTSPTATSAAAAAAAAAVPVPVQSNSGRKRKGINYTALIGQLVVNDDDRSCRGIVVGVEDSMCRVHKKGKRKDEDAWVEASSLRVLNMNIDTADTQLKSPTTTGTAATKAVTVEAGVGVEDSGYRTPRGSGTSSRPRKEKSFTNETAVNTITITNSSGRKKQKAAGHVSKKSSDKFQQQVTMSSWESDNWGNDHFTPNNTAFSTAESIDTRLYKNFCESGKAVSSSLVFDRMLLSPTDSSKWFEKQ